jgi:hypothetical protein
MRRSEHERGRVSSTGQTVLSFSLLLLLCFVAATSLAAEKEAASPRLNWSSFKSFPGHFSVLMPDNPVCSTQMLATAEGKLKVIRFASWKDGFPVCVAKYSELPEAGRKKMREHPEICFDPAQAQEQGKGARLVNKFDFKSPGSGNPVRVVEVVKDKEGMFLRQKLYMTEDRFYELTCAVPTNQISSREISRFFDSWKITR